MFTPFSTGKINVLTADEKVLNLIPGMDTATVENILKLRGETEPPLRSLAQLAGAGANPQAMQQISRYLDVRGDTYEVHATATIGSLSHEFTAVVFRRGANVQVVSFCRTK